MFAVWAKREKKSFGMIERQVRRRYCLEWRNNWPQGFDGNRFEAQARFGSKNCISLSYQFAAECRKPTLILKVI